MWARVFEFSLSCWLAMSPFIFRYPKGSLLFYNDFACSALIALFSLLSYKHSFSRMHLLNILIAIWLFGLGFIPLENLPTSSQENYVVFGFLLGMVSIVPSHTTLPPKKWRDFIK